MTIRSIEPRTTPLAHAAAPSLGAAAAPSPEEATEASQVAHDPLAPTARNGWSPAEINAVPSQNATGFVGSALDFTLGGVEERPGQRLSTAMVDQTAPFFATQFGLDEGFVRRELAKVYLYTGGPAPDNTAMTIGHHIFVPDEKTLERILSPQGKNWLVHELAHTMQYASYHESSGHRFLADYFESLVVGKDPQQPGSGAGAPVWGSLFTGMRSTGKTEDELGDGATSFGDRLVSSAVPALATGLPVGLAVGGGLAAARLTTGTPGLLGKLGGYRTGLALVAAPALAGSLAGAFGDVIGDGAAQGVGTLAGGAIAGGTLFAAGAFSGGRGRMIGAAAATLGGAAVGWLTSAASANTVQGWSRSSEVLTELAHPDRANEPLSYSAAIHDAHWAEIDAEAVARTFDRGDWDRPKSGEPVQGRTPHGPENPDTVDGDLTDRVDWGLKVPLIVGIPAGVALGAGVLATRTGVTMLRTTLHGGGGVLPGVRAALTQLGSSRMGVVNSLMVGGAMTVAPLVLGGMAAPLAFEATRSEDVARLAGGALGAATGATLLTLLLKGRGASPLATSLKVAGGALVAGGAGILAGGTATDALRKQERRYDVSDGHTAQK
ncbi:MAG: hypothetical protein JWM25_1234 [Thermoleophilia bacterium]|nr:hypothetical protein [Thermoleophilia bacterium]MCZ4496651.1 hypothetical protein [Thermoleophilia bacterium]